MAPWFHPAGKTRGLADSPGAVLLIEAVNPSRRQLGLLCTLLPQLVLALLAPALVICQEGNGDRGVELSVTSCCVAEGSQAGESERLRKSEEECGGCQDAVLAVTLRREESQASLALSLELFAVVSPSWSWDAVSPPTYAPVTSLAPNGALAAFRTVNLRC